MSKSARIVTLTVTAVLTAAVFAGLWMVRPSQDSQVLSAARERQREGLIAVAEPLETDIAALTEQEKFAAEVQAILLNDSAFRSEIAAVLLADEEFVGKVSEAVMPDVDKRVDALVASYAADYEQMIIDLVEQEGLKYSDTTRLVDELIDPVTTRIYNDFSSNSEYIDRLSEAVSERVDMVETGITADEIEPLVIDVYNKYSEDIITEIVQRVLASLDGYTASAASETVEETAPAAEVETVPEVPAPPVFETVNPEQQRVVSAPDFTSVTVVPESDYSAVRNAEREKAIRAVLDSLSN